jgi:hypothetical protein
LYRKLQEEGGMSQREMSFAFWLVVSLVRAVAEAQPVSFIARRAFVVVPGPQSVLAGKALSRHTNDHEAHFVTELEMF